MLFTTVPSKRLAESINAASLTIQLNNIEGWDGNDLTSSDFGTRLFAVLRNDTNTAMEIIELDPATIASASITVLKRGLKFTGDLSTEVTANKLTWVKNVTIVELGSDVPQLLNHMVQVIGAQTIAGVKTFSSLPATTAGDPVAGTDLARKAYVDAVAFGTTTVDRLVVPGNGGENVAAGNLVYLDVTDTEWKKSDADTAATVDNVLLGIAQGTGTDGVAISGGVLLIGVDYNQSGLTLNSAVYAGNTAGVVSNSAGTTEVTIGFTRTATSFYFCPRVNQQLTENQQDALAGTSGTPSSSNRYITEADKTGTNLPVGSIISYSLASAPTGFLLCDGSAVSRTTYATLFGVIADTFGPGDGSTTFNVPNLLGKVIVGIKTTSKTVIENCEDAWNESVDSDVTASLDTVDFKLGSGSAKFVVAAGASAGDILATEVIAPSSTAFHGKTHITMWIKSTVALSAGDLQLLLDDTGSCASPLESLNVPAVIANTWTRVYMPLADPGLLTSVISIGIKMVVDKGAFTLNLDDIAIGEAMELGVQGGYESYSTSIGEMPAHTHPGTYVGNGAATGNTGPVYGDSATTGAGSVPTQGGDIAHPNMQPYLAMSYIIKT